MGEEEKEEEKEEEEENIDQNATTTTTIDHSNDDRDDEKQHQNNRDGDGDAMNVDTAPAPAPPTTTTTTTDNNNNNHKDVEEEEDLEDLEAMEEEGDEGEEDDGDDGGDDDGDGDEDDEDNNDDEDNTNDENNEEEENDEENDDEQEQERGPKILAKVTNNEHIAISSSLQMTEQQRYALRQQVAAYAHICQQLLQITHEAANALPAKKPHAAIAPTTTTAKVIMKDSPNNNNIPISTHQQQLQPQPLHQQQQSYQHKILPQIPGRPIGFTGTYEKSGGTGKPPASVFSNTGVYRSGKARWTPSPAQFKRLEEMFAIDTTTPQREHLTSVTLELSALGPVQEANVYNWFQNKKARLKARAQEEEKRRLGSLM